ADFGMSLCIAHQAPQRAWRDDGIVIQEEEIAAMRATGRLIVGTREPSIDAVANEDHLRKFAGHHVGGAIAGSVVHYNHFDLGTSSLAPERLQTAAQQVAAIPVGNTN